jgi:hypothetical protein
MLVRCMLSIPQLPFLLLATLDEVTLNCMYAADAGAACMPAYGLCFDQALRVLQTPSDTHDFAMIYLDLDMILMPAREAKIVLTHLKHLPFGSVFLCYRSSLITIPSTALRRTSVLLALLRCMPAVHSGTIDTTLQLLIR